MLVYRLIPSEIGDRPNLGTVEVEPVTTGRPLQVRPITPLLHQIPCQSLAVVRGEGGLLDLSITTRMPQAIPVALSGPLEISPVIRRRRRPSESASVAAYRCHSYTVTASVPKRMTSSSPLLRIGGDLRFPC